METQEATWTPTDAGNSEKRVVLGNALRLHCQLYKESLAMFLTGDNKASESDKTVASKNKRRPYFRAISSDFRTATVSGIEGGSRSVCLPLRLTLGR